MKVVLSENKVNNVIYKYLTNNYYPDYGWSEELFDFYGNVSFNVNDTVAFEYLDTPIFEKKLNIYPWLAKELDEIFGRLWVPVFIEWFQNNTNLTVNTIHVDSY